MTGGGATDTVAGSPADAAGGTLTWRGARAVAGWLVLNFCFNFFNKWLFPRFHYPAWILLNNNIFTFVACLLLLVVVNPSGSGSSSTLDWAVVRRYWGWLLVLATLHGFDLLLENMSLQTVSLALNQVVKSTVPFFSLLFAKFVERKHVVRDQFLCTVFIVVGAGLTAYRNPEFELVGFLCSCGSAVLASLKTLFSALLLERAQMPPLALTFYTALPSALVLLPVFVGREMDAFGTFAADHVWFTLGVTLLTSVMAVAYNWIHYLLIHETSALYSTLVGNVKVVLVVLVSLVVFQTQLIWVNVVGILVTLASFLAFHYVKHSGHASGATKSPQSGGTALLMRSPVRAGGGARGDDDDDHDLRDSGLSMNSFTIPTSGSNGGSHGAWRFGSLATIRQYDTAMGGGRPAEETAIEIVTKSS